MNGDYRHEENQGCETQMDNGGLNEIAFVTVQDREEELTGGCPEGETFEITDWLTMTYTGKGIFAPIQIGEINWVTHFLPKIAPSDKGKGKLEDFSSPNPVEEKCQLVLNNAWEAISNLMADFDKWMHFRTVVKLRDITSFEDLTRVEVKFLFVSRNGGSIRTVAMTDVVVLQILMDTQTSLKLDFGRYKNIFYGKVDMLAANVTTSQTALETIIINQLAGQQYQLTTDLDMVKLQLVELVEHLKRIGDAKKGEGG
ncbi:receptor-like protein kinase [Dorcoceras hygrometricum]|uniref:Receptor-like protein kinase n=1 Tax=Dorcoceras hygrometricum TaxID=472368 RepID=A0A2Z7ATW3_9LAMI|nr:receptor-like protein kinase [Dorcoceras hygrometricum]